MSDNPNTTDPNEPVVTESAYPLGGAVFAEDYVSDPSEISGFAAAEDDNPEAHMSADEAMWVVA
ncbi:hypothetical protein [Alloactinosynnema sp. L-07]|uniref:hypothetical protein n=1 Tax=Alloactinosynnema sp. L-07 TaxID=1653480 RepID=UPI00065EF4C7|nr:hypothetical protein [Alloactinosynnema sp. L-07]CRK55420.1 hypothetical protein [Alloactinosynnema sp. L-07]